MSAAASSEPVGAALDVKRRIADLGFWIVLVHAGQEGADRLLLSGRARDKSDWNEAQALLRVNSQGLAEIADCDVPAGWAIRLWRDEVLRRLALMPPGSPQAIEFEQWATVLETLA